MKTKPAVKKPAVKKPATTRSAIAASTRALGQREQRIDIGPQHIELIIKTPDLENILIRAIKTIIAAAAQDKLTPSATSELHAEMDERRQKLAEDQHELQREEFAQRVREWQAQEARRAKGEPVY